MPPEKPSSNGTSLFQREGVYYARVKHSVADELIEIALHGTISEEQARAAFEALTALSNDNGTNECAEHMSLLSKNCALILRRG